ncbi:serpentine type 7TM GPCR chemoreceptor str domain-containing protein [Ditylenchus destructor]|uniref:Serpentine type 7TM GPCR chemoreceptor str domain-containing protein n=1 Tax=Ditylenchus destructor TaxID=166010 RepID=A0AAD4QVJ0_9BILA|nr:serpentine type 7TM GPCR chemoreceptor str domain-containing protein [Ditylenchus destructor]
MTSYYTTNQVNGTIFFVSGILLNCLLIKLICKSGNPMSDRGYKPILLQVCITDLLNLAMTFFYMPAYVVAGEYDLCYTAGFFNDIFQDAPVFTILTFRTWFFFHFFALCSPAVQFSYRYLVLCREYTPSYRLYAALLSPVVLIYTMASFLAGVLVYVSRSSNTQYQKLITTTNPSSVDLVLIQVSCFDATI